MTRQTTVAVSVLFMWLAVLSSGCAKKQALRITLEKTWESYLVASKSGKESEFNPADLPATYEIDGTVRKAPEPISPPDTSGLLDVFSYGYKTEVIVNGVKQGKPVEASHSGLLKGGLRKGENSITIVVVQTEKDTSFHPRVNIRRVFADRKTEEVFKFEPKENVEGRHTLSLPETGFGRTIFRDVLVSRSVSGQYESFLHRAPASWYSSSRRNGGIHTEERRSAHPCR